MLIFCHDFQSRTIVKYPVERNTTTHCDDHDDNDDHDDHADYDDEDAGERRRERD